MQLFSEDAFKETQTAIVKDVGQIKYLTDIFGSTRVARIATKTLNKLPLEERRALKAYNQLEGFKLEIGVINSAEHTQAASYTFNRDGSGSLKLYIVPLLNVIESGTITHELVHHQQHIDGRFAWLDDGRMTFDGQVVETANTVLENIELPYEKEAYLAGDRVRAKHSWFKTVSGIQASRLRQAKKKDKSLAKKGTCYRAVAGL